MKIVMTCLLVAVVVSGAGCGGGGDPAKAGDTSTRANSRAEKRRSLDLNDEEEARRHAIGTWTYSGTDAMLFGRQDGDDWYWSYNWYKIELKKNGSYQLHVAPRTAADWGKPLEGGTWTLATCRNERTGVRYYRIDLANEPRQCVAAAEAAGSGDWLSQMATAMGQALSQGFSAFGLLFAFGDDYGKPPEEIDWSRLDAESTRTNRVVALLNTAAPLFIDMTNVLATCATDGERGTVQAMVLSDVRKRLPVVREKLTDVYRNAARAGAVRKAYEVWYDLEQDGQRLANVLEESPAQFMDPFIVETDGRFGFWLRYSEYQSSGDYVKSDSNFFWMQRGDPKPFGR